MGTHRPREDTRRWWMVGCHGSEPHFFSADTGRSAVAQFRAHLVEMERQGAGLSIRDARYVVSGLNPCVLEGPLTTERAFELDLGWVLARHIADGQTGFEVNAINPITPTEALKHHLDADTVNRLEHNARQRYGLPAQGVAA